MIGRLSLSGEARRALAWGTTWGLAVAVCEALATSPQRWESPQLLLWWLTYWTVPFWCASGALLIWLLPRAERRAGRAGMIGCYLALAAPVAFLQPLISSGMMHLSQQYSPALFNYALHNIGALPVAGSLGSLAISNLWIYLFYAGLLTAAYMMTRRTERIRSMLHASAMARIRTERLIDAQRLEVLQTQVDPKLLLQTMREMEQCYRSSPERGERLLAALVEFLRYAMHGLRLPVSTLECELRLARAFAHLQQERAVAGAWRIEGTPAGIRGGAIFPSHLMLPLLALSNGSGRPLLRTVAEGPRTVLQLFGLAHGVPKELRQQLQARLYAVYGENFQLDYSVSAPTQLSIVLNHASPA